MGTQAISTNSFSYNGKTYFFQATIFTKTDLYSSHHGLDFNNCVTFEYQNQLNSLAIPAVLTYRDVYGVIDKYIEKPFVQSMIVFAEVTTEIKDDEIVVRDLDDKAMLSMTFLVTKIEIVERHGREVIYKLHMISSNWINLTSIIDYTNYSKNPEQIFKIIKNILSDAQLEIDDKSFDEVKSEVKINYITNGNDTVLTCIKYLLSKMIYYKKYDESWKFIFFDEQKNKYRLFDFSNINTIVGSRLFIFGMFNSETEQLFQEDPLGLTTVNSFTNVNLMNTGFNYKITDYDYQHNKFVKEQLKNEDIVKLRNESFLKSFNDEKNKTYLQKFEKLPNTTLNLNKKATYWNDNQLMSQYNYLCKAFCENNAIIVDCAGEIVRKPSDVVTLRIDRKVQSLSDEEPEVEDDITHKYTSFEGAWVTSKIHHIIDFQSAKYRANVMLFRNCITDTIEKSAK